MKENNKPWYVFIKKKKIIKTQVKPKRDKVAIFPIEKAANKYAKWLERINK